MKNIWYRIERIFFMTLKQLQDPYYHGFAAQISFYLLLSIVPVILLLVQILGICGISTETALQLIEEYTGKRMSEMVNSLFAFNSLGAGNIIFLIIALWAGSRASFSISRITNYTLSEGRTTGKNYFIERARAVTTVVMTILTLVLSIVILCYGKVIIILVFNLLGIAKTEYVDNIWFLLRWPLAFFLYLMMISVIYYILPTKKMPIKDLIPGAGFAAFGVVVVSWCYSYYTNSLANYDIMYGALSSVVAIMMWFLFISWVLILGVMLNKGLADTRKPFSKQDPPEHMWNKGSVYGKSKYDINPKEVSLGEIKKIITGNVEHKDIDE